MNNLHVLIVDDEWNMRNLLKIYLTKEGFIVKEAMTGIEALTKVKQEDFDVILLDIMMPDMDGWEVCKSIRKIKTTPIMMLTARAELQEKVKGFATGADDYLTKPFNAEELIARVHALIRRSSISYLKQNEKERLDFPDITIEPDARQVTICHQTIEFTQIEFDILVMLAKNKDRAFSREHIVERVWGYDFEGDSRVVDTHVKNIREKITKAGLSYNPIQTVWGIGYKFHIPGTIQ
ncbi:response regulator transcription factor [Terrilactibacillus laevilacticus]|uniref:Response regulator transcription factor n=1 Tax=Terrilactibacillus laevilacticus TaxID=1380157 RepID=A0ABW5PSS1_9BACI|nr:response regulator transcription factor [Terrilactibacillus laevilacticus]